MMEKKKSYEYGIKIKDLELKDRPREKLELFGSKYLSDEELLAIIIGTGSKNLNAIELANEVMLKIKNQSDFMDISISELMQINGIGLSKASKIIAALELAFRLNLRKTMKVEVVNSPEIVANLFMYELKNKLKENFYILLLNTKNGIISRELISQGTLNGSLVHPREVFKPAIKKSANSIILVHNHPSGNTKPSEDDILITNRLVKAGNILGIKVLDHLIIGDGDFFSFKERKYI